MPSLNFKRQFVPMIEDGSKTHSIRAGERFKVGDKVYLFTGLRTKQCRDLRVRGLSGPFYCRAVEPIHIDPSGIILNGQRLSQDELNEFA